MSRTLDIFIAPERTGTITQTVAGLKSIMRHGRGSALPMPTGLYGLLRTKGVCLPHRGRFGTCGHICGNGGAGLRTQIRLSHGETIAAACAAPGPMPLFARRRLFHSSGKAYPVPHLSLLAGAGREQAGMEEDGPILSGNGSRAADSDRVGGGAGSGDAGSLSRAVPLIRSRERERVVAGTRIYFRSPIRYRSLTFAALPSRRP